MRNFIAKRFAISANAYYLCNVFQVEQAAKDTKKRLN